MKLKFTLLLAFSLCFSIGGFAQTVWDDFDNPANCVYSYWDGTAFDQNFANPVTTGDNPSAVCARYVRNNGAQYDVIVIDPTGTNVVADVSDYLTGAKTLKMKVFSPSAGLVIQITLEDQNSAGPTNYPTGRHSEHFDTTTVSGAWETLEFSFVNRPDPAVADTSVNRLVLLFEPNTNSSNVWLWDDLMGPEFVDPCQGVTPDPSIGDDAECQRNVSYDFSNGSLVTVANPITGGINASSESGKFTKFLPPTSDGAFGGSLNNPFTIATYDLAHIQLYDPAAPQEFHMIFQDPQGNNLLDTIFNTSSTSVWEAFEMDLSSIASGDTIAKFVFLLNPGTTTEDSIFFDNFTFSQGVANSLSESQNPGLKVFPVPFENRLHLTSPVSMEHVDLLDLSGKVLLHKDLGGQRQFVANTSELHPGVYFLRVERMNGGAEFIKVIRE